MVIDIIEQQRDWTRVRLQNQNKQPGGKKQRAFVWYLASLVVLVMGALLAARHYPGGFDWRYTVASALASQKHNPNGSIWFAMGFLFSMSLLWPFVGLLKEAVASKLPAAGITISLMRLGLVCGVLVAIERLFIHDLSAWVYKAHELLAILFFLGWYLGVLVLLGQAMIRHKLYVLPVILIASPLLAIGLTEFWLYLEQRELGWADTNWQEKGIPLWLSFAFWQWLAIGFLWAGIALLAFIYIEPERHINNSLPHE